MKEGGSYLGICAGGYYGSSFVEFAKDDPVMEIVGERELAFYPGTACGPMFPYDYSNNSGARTLSIALTPEALGLIKGALPRDHQLQKNILASTSSNVHIVDGSPVSMCMCVPVFFNGGCCFLPHVSSNSDVISYTASDTSHHRVRVRVLGCYGNGTPVPGRGGEGRGGERGGGGGGGGGGEGGESAAAIVLSSVGKGKAVLSGVHLEAGPEQLLQVYPGDSHIAALCPALSSSHAHMQRHTCDNTCMYTPLNSTSQCQAALPSCRELLFNSIINHLLH